MLGLKKTLGQNYGRSVKFIDITSELLSAAADPSTADSQIISIAARQLLRKRMRKRSPVLPRLSGDDAKYFAKAFGALAFASSKLGSRRSR